MQRKRRSQHNNPYKFSAAMAIPLLPIKLSSSLATVSAAMLQVFENDDHTSTFLAFAMIWIVTATFALASAYLVFRIAEARRRLFARVTSVPAVATATTRTRARS
jgi:hypothetical protein